MARKTRVDWEGAWHHVMNRGARRQPIFEANEHCEVFLTAIGEARKRYGLEIHAYALMTNHYHLLVRSVRGNLSDAMRHLAATYTMAINELKEWDGPMFKGRFRNQLLVGADHIRTVAAYIHLNPVRAKLVSRVDEDNAWTSHRAYLGLDVPPPWLTRDVLLAELGGPDGFGQFVHEHRLGSRQWPDGFDADTGWWRKSEQEERPWSLHGASALEEQPVAVLCQPEQVLAWVGEITGATRRKLRTPRRGPGANPQRRFAAWALDRFTDLSQRKIGALLDMSPSQTSKVLIRLRRELSPPLDGWSALMEERVSKDQSG